MTTPHIGNEDELVTADHADDETEQPEQAAQAENTVLHGTVYFLGFYKKINLECLVNFHSGAVRSERLKNYRG